MQRTQTTCLVILSVIAVGFSLKYLQTVLLPFVIALFVVVGIRPILDYLQRRLNLNQWVSVGVTFTVGILAMAVTGLAIWVSINDVARNSGVYEKRLAVIGDWFEKYMEGRNGSGETKPESNPANSESAANPENAAPTKNQMVDDSGDLNTPAIPSEEMAGKTGDSKSDTNVGDDSRQAVQKAFAGLSDALESLLLNLVGSMSSLLSYGIMIALFVFFLLSSEPGIGKRPQIVDEVEEQVRKYLVMKTVISVLTGFAFGGVLWIFGVPLAILFGMLAFLLNYIPNIGPLIANVLPIPLLVLNSDISIGAAITCIILITAVQFISGNVVETRVMGKSFDVSPIVLLLALMFFGLVWGIVGMFLATPLVSIIKIVLDNTRGGKPIAELMAGRWTPMTART